MASMISYSAIGNSSLPVKVPLVPDKSGGVLNDGFSFRTGNVTRSKKCNVRGLTVTKVATPVTVPLQAAAPSWAKEKSSSYRNHVAWTNVRQERWEGELIVEGDIPLWLVRT